MTKKIERKIKRKIKEITATKISHMIDKNGCIEKENINLLSQKITDSVLNFIDKNYNKFYFLE